jgi:uncharacterized protein
MRQTGIANLPLHGGKAPPWLFQRMVRLGREIVRLIVEDQGPRELLTRISDPYWFQSLGCVLGFDWHSSGVTTTVCGALKEGLRGMERELGLVIAGGKGATSRKTPAEIVAAGERYSLARDPKELVQLSRLTAKIDNNAVQDGFQLYHHNFFFTLDGAWAVVQQGMSDRYARRYHWHSETVKELTVDPHSAICAPFKQDRVLNLVAAESVPAQDVMTELSRESPDKIVRELNQMKTLTLPARHSVAVADLRPESIEKILLKTYEAQANNFETLLGMPGVGAKTLRALALISEVTYGTAASWKDPAKFSFAHGGKDGHPYRVNRQVYDQSIEILRKTLERVRVERSEKDNALKRLNTLWAEDKPAFPLARE